jgi:hypothetical protein
MDPITIILTALVTGAAAGLKPTAETVVKDAYEAIKGLIKRKYPGVSVDNLEGDVASKNRQNVVREDLEKHGAGADGELLAQAKAVIEAVRQYAPDDARSVGVDISQLKAASLTVEDVEVDKGTGVKIEGSDVAGDVKVSHVRAGGDRTKR